MIQVWMNMKGLALDILVEMLNGQLSTGVWSSLGSALHRTDMVGGRQEERQALLSKESLWERLNSVPIRIYPSLPQSLCVHAVWLAWNAHSSSSSPVQGQPRKPFIVALEPYTSQQAGLWFPRIL